MKNLRFKNPIALIFMSILLFYACEGPPGPSGFDGRDGIDGVNGEESFVFEYEFDFTAPDYAVSLNLPTDFTMLESDVILVYLLWEVLEDNTEVWRLAPQTLYIDGEALIYNYDFTISDAEVFMDGTVNLDGLGAEFTDGWVARVVVVPGQFNDRSVLDITNYNEVINHYNISPSKLAGLDYIKKPY